MSTTLQLREPGAERVHLHASNHSASQQKLRTSSDYVTWTETLHPEKKANGGEGIIRFPGHPLGTVYEGWKSDMPSAVAVAVDEQAQTMPTTTTTSNDNNINNNDHAKPHFLCLCSPIELLVAFMVIVLTLGGVLLCEILGLAWYIGAFVFYWLAKPLDPPNFFTGIFYSFFMIFHYAFMMADSVCLVASVCVAESCALVCWLTSMLFGGILLANYRHQYIRSTCHAIRGAFRGSWLEPPRHLVFFSKPATTTTTNVRMCNKPPQTEMVPQAAMVVIDDLRDVP